METNNEKCIEWISGQHNIVCSISQQKYIRKIKKLAEKYTATLSCTKKESLNEDLAIEIIKENLGGALLSSVIKQKEYIDEDALEKLVYNGDFDINKLAKAKIVKETYTLRVNKKKDD